KHRTLRSSADDVVPLPTQPAPSGPRPYPRPSQVCKRIPFSPTAISRPVYRSFIRPAVHIHYSGSGLAGTRRDLLDIRMPGLVRTGKRVHRNPAPQVTGLHQIIQSGGWFLLIQSVFVD